MGHERVGVIFIPRIADSILDGTDERASASKLSVG